MQIPNRKSLSKSMIFNKGENPYQDAFRLVRLRNALVHYKPEWDTSLNEHAKLESSLSGCFPESPFSHKNDAFFPKRCLGHGCAEWAVKNVITFMSNFQERLGVQDNFPPKEGISTS